MPTIISDPYSGNIFGRLGKGIGQGLSEQVPKEIENNRLSNRLKEIEANVSSENPMTPFQQAAALYGVPGGKEAAPHLLPLLQQQQANSAYLSQNKQGQNKNINPVVAKNEKPIDRSLRPNYLTASSPDQIKANAAELYAKNPAQYGFKIGNAEAQAEKDDARRISEDTGNEARITKTRDYFNDSVSTALQKDTKKDIYGDISGDLLNDFREMASNDTSLNPKESGHQYAKKILDFAKNQQNLKKLGSFGERSNWNITPKLRQQRLENIRDEYAKYDKLEDFKNLLVGQGMSDAYANYVAHPIKENKEINNYIKNLPKPKESFAKKLFKYESESGKEPEIAKNIGKNLMNGDSINSIALQLKQQGFSGTAFLDEINRLHREKKINLTPEQARELEGDRNLKPNLNDILIFSNGGLNPLMEVK